MQTYKLVTQTSTGGLQWEYNFDMASDTMAIEYAMRHTAQFASTPWFMSMLLFRDDNERDWVPVGEYAVNSPTVHVVERRR